MRNNQLKFLWQWVRSKTKMLFLWTNKNETTNHKSCNNESIWPAIVHTVEEQLNVETANHSCCKNNSVWVFFRSTLIVVSLFSAYNIGHEGDIALTERDWNVYEKTRFRRNAVRQRKKIWPNRVIPYEIEEGLGKLYLQLLKYRDLFFFINI